LNGDATRPWADAMAMKRAESLPASDGQAYFARRNGLVRSRAIRLSHLSSGKSTTGSTC